MTNDAWGSETTALTSAPLMSLCLLMQVRMSGVVHVKTLPCKPSSSGIPLPNSLLPSSPRSDPRRRACNLPKPSMHTPTHTPSQSPLLNPRNSTNSGLSPRTHPRGSAQKSQLFQRKAALPVSQVSRSAYSSPLTHRRAPPHSKDSLDLGKQTPAYIPSQFLHDGNCNTSDLINKNQTLGPNTLPLPLHLKRENNFIPLVQEGKGKDAQAKHPPWSSTVNNGNIQPSGSKPRQPIRGRSDSSSQSDEEMESPEDCSPLSLPDPLIMCSAPIMSSVHSLDHSLQREEAEAQGARVNMATVAPFSFR